MLRRVSHCGWQTTLSRSRRWERRGVICYHATSIASSPATATAAAQLYVRECEPIDMRAWYLIFLPLLLAACGGGSAHGINQSIGNAAGGAAASAAPAILAPATPTVAVSSLAGQCAQPRAASDIDPDTGQPYGDRPGSLGNEKAWIRAWASQTYLWYAELPLVDPAAYLLGTSVTYIDPANNARRSVTLSSNYQVLDAYFNSQRSLALSASGRPKDRFHFTSPTSVWQALARSGASVGFGFQVALLAAAPPRKVVVSLVGPSSNAEANGIVRGMEILSVNGVDVVSGSDVATLNEGIFSPQLGKTYSFQLRDAGGLVRSVSLVAGNVTVSAVTEAKTLPQPNERVGYIAFHDHLAIAENQLSQAVQRLKLANQGSGVDDLVLDLRYNGGGYLDIAAELAYMIAGADATNGKFFERLAFNDKNPFELSPTQSTTPFHAKSLGLSSLPGQDLPQLGLRRVYVITGNETCSASEAIINGLRGAGVEVLQIGATTCGKPYGFFPADNCGTTYFTIQFKGVNYLGYGDYVDGFVPGGSAAATNSLPGCAVADDFTRQLGDPAELRLAAALQLRASGSCPRAQATAQAAPAPAEEQAPGEPLTRPPLRDNRFYLRR